MIRKHHRCQGEQGRKHRAHKEDTNLAIHQIPTQQPDPANSIALTINQGQVFAFEQLSLCCGRGQHHVPRRLVELLT